MLNQQTFPVIWPENPFRKQRPYIKASQGITAEEYSKQIGMSKPVARRRLEAMVETGQATRIETHLPTGKKVLVIRYMLKSCN